MAEKLFEVDYSDFKNIQKAAEVMPREARAALANALNRTATKTVTYAHDAVIDNYTLKRKAIKQTMSIKKANQSRLEAVVTSTDKRTMITGFSYGKQGKNRIAQPEIIRGRKVLSKSNPPLFVGRGKGHGKQMIFRREAPGSNKLKVGYSVGIPQMIKNEKSWEYIGMKAGLFLQQRFEHEFEQKLIRTLTKYSDKR